MKKKLLILGLLIGSLSFMAFKIFNTNKVTSCNKNLRSIKSNTCLGSDFLDFSNIVDPRDIVYKVESRFLSTISKSDLNKAETIIDILPKKATESIESYYYARVSILDDHVETDRRAYADSEVLTAAQIDLLNSTNDSGNIYIKSDYKIRGGGSLYDRQLTYFISIVPHQQAEYQDGHESMISYLREHTEEEVKIIKKGSLKGGKVRFTITADGQVSKVELTSTSGYPSIDKKLVEIVENIPGNWTPASNEEGEKVDQELVFFFGQMGC
ncbi:MAG: hypothetical protein ACI9P5_003473 [Saprospiraceae bacterium]|jgi:hypothetical protein